MNADPSMPRLFTFEFFVLCLIVVMAFSNVSVFYSFYHYLGVIGIPVAWRGVLVGLEPMTAFGLRLFLLPWLHLRNAYAIVMGALVLLIAISCSYLWVTAVPAMIALRIIHGAVFVLLTSAVISLMVQFIPEKKSGQGFSALSIATMIPYAIIPPLSEFMLPYVRNAADIYAAVSVFSLLGILLMLAVRGRISAVVGRMDEVLMRRPPLSEIRNNFRQRDVALMLLSIFFIYLAHPTLFFFMKNLSLQRGIGHVGVFFTVTMAATIAVRVFGAALFDRLNKLRLLMIFLVLLILCLIALPHAASLSVYYLLAAVYGASVGAVLPIQNALLFSASAPSLRGLNANMSLFAMDAGYFLTPYLGGTLITLGAEFGILFYTAAGFTLLCLCLIVMLGYTKKSGGNDIDESRE